MNDTLLKAKGVFKKYMKKYNEVIIIYCLLMLFIILSAILDKNFLSIKNLINIFATSMPFLMAAYAQTIAIISGGVDLSVGATISLVTTICATTMMDDTPFGILSGVLISLVAAVAIGILNGLLITKFKIQALIGTLCSSIVIAGIALAILDMPGGKVPKGFAKFVSGDASLIVIFLITTVVLSMMMSRTRLGKSLYATGGNSQAAYNVGINVTKTKILSFAVGGILTALAGIILACQMRSGDPTAGNPITIKTLTASVIGGASFSGGKGRIICTFAGAMIFAIINNMLNLLGISTFYQYVAQGVLLILAIAITSKSK